MATKTPSSPQLGFMFQAEPELQETPVAPRRARERRTWLVSQLVAQARELVEAEFGDVWVEGEISNLRPASSGHLYFTLKDADAQLPVVLFRRQALLLRFKPDNGLHVRVRGKASVYEQRGQLQMVAETMEPVGAGSLQLAYEQLRDRLKAEGLFDQERKRPLPAYPRCVAVITSSAGAVIRDFLNIAGRRHSGLDVIVIPVAVQGDGAAAEIAQGIALANESGQADLIVLARGGGSLEDMAAFNAELVARAIAASELPVVSAVGHETDFTIADFVADLRAPTPSAAAELITEAQHKVEELVETLERRLIRAQRYQIIQAQQSFGRVDVTRAEQRMTGMLHRLEQRVDDLGFRLEATMLDRLRNAGRKADELHAGVLRHDPRRQLGKIRTELGVSETRLWHALEHTLARARYECRSLDARLLRAGQVAVANRRAAHVAMRGQLQSLSPLAVLQRGYALVQDESGLLLRSVAQVSQEQALTVRLADGSFTSRVMTITPDEKKQGKANKDRASRS